MVQILRSAHSGGSLEGGHADVEHSLEQESFLANVGRKLDVAERVLAVQRGTADTATIERVRAELKDPKSDSSRFVLALRRRAVGMVLTPQDLQYFRKDSL